MFKTIALFAIVFTLLSCSNNDKKVRIPEYVFETNKMADIYVDIMLLESTISLGTLSADSILHSKTPPSQQLLNKHEITKEQYEKNLEFYYQNLDSLNSVFYIVIDKLSEMKAEVSSQITLQKEND
jgi:hypothetical protein